SGEAERTHVRLLPPEPGPPWHLVRVFVAAASLQLGAGAAAGAGGLADDDAGHRTADPESSGEGGGGQAAGGSPTRGATQNGRGRPCQGLPLTWVSYSAFPQPAALLGGNRRGREVDLDLGFLAGPDCHRLGARLGLAVANHFRLQRVAVLQAALESGGDEHALSGGRGRRIAIDRQHGISREIDDDRRRGRLDAGLLLILLLVLLLLRLDRDRGRATRGAVAAGAALAATAA